MDRNNQAELKYPIGRFVYNENMSNTERSLCIKEIAEAPVKLREAVSGLNNEQLDTQYRPGGWTVRQVVHHLPDSHINAYVRMKLALTEDIPEIKTYEEQKWAELGDTVNTDISVSINLLEALHKRWVNLWESLTEKDYKINFRHPEIGLVTLDWLLAQYAWHGKHHVAHITSLRKRMGW